MRLEIGNRVRCTDGAYGELADIVIDPLEKRVTHLVIQPEQDDGQRRLVPIQLAKGRDDKQREIELECTLDEAQGFESVHEGALQCALVQTPLLQSESAEHAEPSSHGAATAAPARAMAQAPCS